MPQMSPMNWMAISMLMAATLLTMSTSENTFNSKKKTKQYYLMKNMNWSW